MRSVRRIGCNATEKRGQCITSDYLFERTYKGDAAAPPNHREKQESKAGHNVKTKGLNEPTSEELALGNAFFAS